MNSSSHQIRACLFMAGFIFWAALQANAAPPAVLKTVVVDQPVHEYFWSFEEHFVTVEGKRTDRNPLRFYTHLGTDCGRMGPAERQISWREGAVHVDPSFEWCGMWHSLAGLARDSATKLNFTQCFPPFIRKDFQTRCVGVYVNLKGKGFLKLELTSVNKESRWHEFYGLTDSLSRQEVRFDDATIDRLREVKFLNWVAEPGTQVTIDSVGLLIEYPKISPEQRLFLVSYAKLARCYSIDSGLVGDRANFPSGDFDSIPATGMFCLATAIAARLNIVDEAFAIAVLEKAYRSVKNIETSKGILAHFVRKYDGRYRIHANTEFSTIDTSLYYHSMLLAAQITGNRDIQERLAKDIKSIDFSRLYTPDGYVVHGMKDDGVTALESAWRDWGGETALVLLLARMNEGLNARLKMVPTGNVHQGVGFIMEIQNLFYRQFDSEIPDAITHQRWGNRRRELLQRQLACFPVSSKVGALGVFGLSAGEGRGGVGYAANGTETPAKKLIHPHYMLMAAPAMKDPQQIYATVAKMEQIGLLPPWGLVENVTESLSEYLPMLGSLNAGFEAIGAYHLWAEALGHPDIVYDAADQSIPLSNAIRAFYP